MAWSVWLALLAATLVISLTPGAGAINTMTNSLNVGTRRAIWGILGQQAALVIHIVIVAAGVGILVSQHEIIYNVIRYAGAAYLVWLGIRQFLRRPQAVSADSSAPPTRPSSEVETSRAGETRWAMFHRGLLVNLTNPKAIVFFLAFTPQFIRPDQALLPQYLVFAATCVLVDILVMWLGFAMAARPLRKLTRSESGQRLINRIFGGLFIGVGVLLAFVH